MRSITSNEKDIIMNFKVQKESADFCLSLSIAGIPFSLFI